MPSQPCAYGLSLAARWLLGVLAVMGPDMASGGLRLVLDAPQAVTIHSQDGSIASAPFTAWLRRFISEEASHQNRRKVDSVYSIWQRGGVWIIHTVFAMLTHS